MADNRANLHRIPLFFEIADVHRTGLSSPFAVSLSLGDDQPVPRM
jgi:hypothetical protein